MDDQDPPPTAVHRDDVAPQRWDDPVRGAMGFRLLLGGEAPTGSLTAGLTEMGPGDWMGHHRHEPAEVYHVLEGEGIVEVSGEELAVGVGSTVLVPGGAEHAARNTGPGPFRFFYVIDAASFADVEYHFRDDPAAEDPGAGRSG